LGATSRSIKIDKDDRINLYAIKDNIFKKAGQKIDLKNHIVLGVGEGFKAEITAKKASVTAISKMEAAGGKIIIYSNKKEVVEEKSEAKPKAKKEVAKKAVPKESKK
jgi:hypothetical protein